MNLFRKTNAERWAIGLYGISSKPNMRLAYESCFSWFESLAGPPSHIGLHGPNLPNRMRLYARMKKKLPNLNFSTLNGFEMDLLEKSRGIPVTEWSITASYIATDGILVLGSTTALLADTVFCHSSELLSLIGITKPRYGTLCLEEDVGDPAMHLLGLNARTPGNYDTHVRYSRWMDTGRSECLMREGVLRDIYPFSYLSAAHLKRPVDGMPLSEWIMVSPEHGRLVPLTDELTMWVVPPQDCPQVRNALKGKNVVFML